jgi:hypothetical protein
MLTNPFETQLVRSLGVRIGGRVTPPEPFEHVRSALATSRPDAFEPGGAAPEERSEPASGPGCPFAAMLAEGTPPAPPSGPPWAPEAEARIARIPEFIRPLARRAIERYAEARGYPTITEAVMDEARGAFGM